MFWVDWSSWFENWDSLGGRWVNMVYCCNIGGLLWNLVGWDEVMRGGGVHWWRWDEGEERWSLVWIEDDK